MKNKLAALSLLLLILTVTNVSQVFAASIGYSEDPLKISIGARAMGMGEAFTAVNGGPYSIFNNPAQLAGQGYGLSSMATSLMGDVNYTVVGVDWPLAWLGRNGNFSVGYAGSSVGQLITPSGGGLTYFDYYNNVLALSYAEKIKLFNQETSLGLRLKQFSEGFTGSTNYAGTGYDMDAGLLMTPWPKTSLGLLMQNFLPQSLGGKVLWPNGDEQGLPMSVRVGLANNSWRDNVTFGLDLDSYVSRKYPARLHAGIEWGVSRNLSLRTGFGQSYDAGSVSTFPTLGVGIMFGAFSFDYAYHPYFSSGDNTTHYFSLNYLELPTVAEITDYISIISPPDRKTTFERKLKVDIKALNDKVKKVSVNGQSATADYNRQFSCQIDLLDGKNAITVEALGDKGQSLQKLKTRVLKLADYSDLPSDNWAAVAIGEVGLLNVIKGYPDGRFDPAGEISRAEMAALLVRVIYRDENKIPASDKIVFPDLQANNWASKYINSAAGQGFIKGYNDGTFRPANKITRAEGTAMIARFDGIAEDNSAQQVFPDLEGKFWATPIIRGAFRAGLLNHFVGQAFEKNKNLTRAEVVDILSRTKRLKPSLDELLDFSTGY
jgi:hypothetical protein